MNGSRPRAGTTGGVDEYEQKTTKQVASRVYRVSQSGSRH